jgi:hypothetical protein
MRIAVTNPRFRAQVVVPHGLLSLHAHGKAIAQSRRQDEGTHRMRTLQIGTENKKKLTLSSCTFHPPNPCHPHSTLSERSERPDSSAAGTSTESMRPLLCRPNGPVEVSRGRGGPGTRRWGGRTQELQSYALRRGSACWACSTRRRGEPGRHRLLVLEGPGRIQHHNIPYDTSPGTTSTRCRACRADGCGRAFRQSTAENEASVDATP